MSVAATAAEEVKLRCREKKSTLRAARHFEGYAFETVIHTSHVAMPALHVNFAFIHIGNQASNYLRLLCLRIATCNGIAVSTFGFVQMKVSQFVNGQLQIFIISAMSSNGQFASCSCDIVGQNNALTHIVA